MFARSLTALGAVLTLALAAHAQPAPMKWGDIPDEHLQMTEYAADPDAQAVILGDYGTIEVGSDWGVKFERHRRVKLLAEAGYDLATVSLTYYAGRDGQRVRGVKGQTFVPEEGGRTRRVKLDKRSIFEEDLEGDRRRITFTLPALEPGAVVEFRYTIEAESPFGTPRWYFQDDEPTLVSELRMTYPQDLAYTIITQGNEPFAVRTKEEGIRSSGDINIYRWVAEEVPALREERYMTTLEDHIQKIDFQLAEYYRPGIGAVGVTKTWAQLAEELGESRDFGRKLQTGGDVRRQAEALTGGLTDAAAKAEALYDFVRTSVVWDDTYRVFAERRLGQVMETKRGSSAEINLLLVALLREAGLNAAPALVSTRGHGRVTRLYPLVSQFNHTAAAVKLGGRWRLLDATDPFRPVDMLPVGVLGGEAWLVAEQPEWIAASPQRSEHHVRIEAALAPDGTLSGTLVSERAGYSGLRARHQLQDLDPEGYARDHLVDDMAGAEVGEVTVTGQEEHGGPLVAEVAFTVPGYAQRVGDLVLVNPLVTMRTDENPFKLARRTYPVDFAYPLVSTYQADIALPEGFAVDEMPERALLLLPVRGGGYERSVEMAGDTLQVRAQQQIKRPVFEPNLYGDLKAFFDRVVATDEASVVLKQAVTAEGTEPEGLSAEQETGGDE
ncbi:MAG: DUF3857 and transglutaminase domain-containing protein [Bacteroidota bacterium]